MSDDKSKVTSGVVNDTVMSRNDDNNPPVSRTVGYDYLKLPKSTPCPMNLEIKMISKTTEKGSIMMKAKELLDQLISRSQIVQANSLQMLILILIATVIILLFTRRNDDINTVTDTKIGDKSPKAANGTGGSSPHIRVEFVCSTCKGHMCC